MRKLILDYLKKELIGPDPIPGYTQENGEEILTSEPPRFRYSAGILFPMEASFASRESTNDAEEKIFEVVEELYDDREHEIIMNDSKSFPDPIEDFEDEIGLSNSYLPSAIGISCFSKIPESGFEVSINAASYQTGEYNLPLSSGVVKKSKAYFRKSHDQIVRLSQNLIPRVNKEYYEQKLLNTNGDEINLKLVVRNRTPENRLEDNVHLLTFSLVNVNINTNSNIKNENCFFQVSFSISTEEKCFLPYQSIPSKFYTEDEKSNHLLYRNRKPFAIGHGCSPIWDEKEIYSTRFIQTQATPIYEIKPIVPRILNQIDLSMLNLSDLSNSDIITDLLVLVDQYQSWIKAQEQTALSELEVEYRETALRHIENCNSCMMRIRQGIEILKSNPKAMRAFRFMNRSILMQQLHYNIETRKWVDDGHGGLNKLSDYQLPDLKDKSTWRSGLGSWRPFQIAFILMNLQGMVEPSHNDREIVDLIWFPTGGGKTEAYLGLTAFTIFFRRLNDKNDDGTAVLMRYTLRLLTAQQFQRAASLICACDLIRKEFAEELGDTRISIGLWVGELTPNKRVDARKSYKQMELGKSVENPFVILKCPWCGAQMGIVNQYRGNKIKGYKRRKIDGIETIVYQCDNEDCEFSKLDYNLPLLVIDEDIYTNPPTLLIGTVDKFAMLPWKPEGRSLFGLRETESTRKSPPSLIIQDELHLISGPLGSMVGLYETMIEALCSTEKVKPKIVASSATISRAKEQVHALYGRGMENVVVFPPQCLDAGNSFFAFEDVEAAGRLYAGIFASASPSHATTQVRVISSLLQSVLSIDVEEEKLRDPYWTSLIYFNSIRELGHAATLIRADIREYLNSIWKRKGIKGDERRFINRDIELTSRVNSSEITEYLELLSQSWNGNKADYPVDICLATNMISVGLDIPRLGVMSVIGQPKTTSEYIQATSRVGRSKNSLGLVLMIYNCSKSRDRSHFEHFQEYHSQVYSKVEPTSVTPFSAPARERALHAILVGLIRLLSDSESVRQRPKPFPPDELVNKVKEIILSRVNKTDGEEYTPTRKLLDEKINEWKMELPLEYGGFGLHGNSPLMFPSGIAKRDDLLGSWPTPTSMRNVDAVCEAYPIPPNVKYTKTVGE